MGKEAPAGENGQGERQSEAEQSGRLAAREERARGGWWTARSWARTRQIRLGRWREVETIKRETPTPPHRPMAKKNPRTAKETCHEFTF
jgi:hypothetical protein